MGDDECRYELMSWNSFCAQCEKRADVCHEDHMTCIANTKQRASWAVFNTLLPGRCSCEDGLEIYQSKVGNYDFYRQSETHTKIKPDINSVGIHNSFNPNGTI